MDSDGVGEISRQPHSILLRHTVVADQATVWRALTEPAGLEAWLGRYEGPPLQRGARFRLWHDGTVPSRHEITEWRPTRQLTMTWDFPNEPPSLVRIGLEPVGTTTTVALGHEGIEDPVSYAAGWHVHLTFLAHFAEGNPRSFEHFWKDYEAQLRRNDTSA